MNTDVLFLLTLLSLLGCGLMAGVFFAFSTFVMSALARLEPPQGIAAMQAINITVINPWFMAVFVGTALVCLFLAIASLFKLHHPSAAYVVVGSLLYLVGTFGVTVAGNVPLNDALAVVKPDTSEAADLWSRYLTNWTLWNHVRTAAALIATAVFAVVLRSSS